MQGSAIFLKASQEEEVSHQDSCMLMGQVIQGLLSVMGQREGLCLLGVLGKGEARSPFISGPIWLRPTVMSVAESHYQKSGDGSNAWILIM